MSINASQLLNLGRLTVAMMRLTSEVKTMTFVNMMGTVMSTQTK